ncbi:tetratricopeptide repeat protein [Candidatus Nitronereus thalassa]|uniref:Tetratricopeptide repeat protein n=1 Tax=Candidatus Nitronereus thalassa TaxID=3020898 RepID=A0ABU3K9S2_9BACT|nr:tetratricopeptide repeat protein [Candidatus Nitronereus thalassa]MDT7043141.1 tetratricopeptide repeat protein [Candidatus Nitronereus thalassa]
MPPPEPGLPPSASDLELLGTTKLCDDKALILNQWKGSTFTRTPWGSGERLERLAQSQQPNFDRFYFFNEEDVLVGAIFRFGSGLNLEPYPILRGTLSQLPPSSAFFLDPAQLLQSTKAKSAVLFRTGSKTSTTQYLVLDDKDRPLLLVASMSIDPYEQLLSSYQKAYLPGLVRSSDTEKAKELALSQGNTFLALQQFARGEAALFSSCGQRQPEVAIDAYRRAVNLGFPKKEQLAEAHHRMGLALRDKDQLQEAQTHLEKALEIRPNVPEVINNLGSVLAQQNKQTQAIELFERAIILRPNYARARFNLAEVLEKMNKRRAIEEYETYLALVEGIPEEEPRMMLVEERLKRLKGK